MLAVVLTVIAAVSVGAAAERRAGAAAHRARARAFTTMLWVLGPFAVYVNIARLQLSLDAALALVVAAIALAGAGALMWLLGRGPLALPRRATGAGIVCAIQANTGYLGLPLCLALFSHAQFTQAVAYDAAITLPMFVLGSYGVGALFGDAGGPRLRARVRAAALRNPILLALVAGLLVPPAWAPQALVEPSRIAVFALLPLGFFTVGVTLADEAEEGSLRIPPPLTRPVAAVAAVRLLFVPAALALAGLAIDVPAPFLLLAAMPVGVNTVLVGHLTGLDLRLTSSAIAWTTTLALVGVLVLDLTGAL